MYGTADRLARSLRPLHPWAQHATIPELSWALVDKVAEGWDERSINVWLREISPAIRFGCTTAWRPQRPHLYIAAQLRLDAWMREEALRRSSENDEGSVPNQEFLAALATLRASHGVHAVMSPLPGIEALSEDDLIDLRQAARAAYRRGDTALIINAVEELGWSAAGFLYGTGLVDRALRLTYARRICLH
ncbi:hypothetical protein CK936_24335 [Streptomyces albireticuli]|uniref:Uncharacterized protein n=2 Tax=Streptomyces albireticuli TaxID=1940 RepID=A0A2A2D1P4_9ACTN|nr:hypothetical protein CK936_24335 [Streptomyces albireticuli]